MPKAGYYVSRAAMPASGAIEDEKEGHRHLLGTTGRWELFKI